jgi:hypothetical protein
LEDLQVVQEHLHVLIVLQVNINHQLVILDVQVVHKVIIVQKVVVDVVHVLLVNMLMLHHQEQAHVMFVLQVNIKIVLHN